jgi:Xaa-Pro dipeptidase
MPTDTFQTRGQYEAHHATLQQRYERVLAAARWDAVAVWSGAPRYRFRDDQAYAHRSGPFYQQWVPASDHASSLVLVRPGARPMLALNLPRDYWHSVPQAPAGEWTESFDIAVSSDLAGVRAQLPDDLSRVAVIGDVHGEPEGWGFGAANPAGIITPLEFARLYKTPYEVACIAAANLRGARGHRAAREAFEQGASELRIHLAYLAATGHAEADLPYDNIIALNEHAATLHYGRFDLEPPEVRRSFLIDAGAMAGGYASDITRTYPGERDSGFAELIAALDEAQQALLALIKPGRSYVDLHEEAQRAIATILRDVGIVDMEPEDMVREGVSNVFLPHGLGHHLGLQVHDSGGKLAGPEGDPIPQPEAWPFLRNLRPIEAGNVFTIEPGLYFIDSLLAELESSPHGRRVNWDAVASLRPCGGVRIEDNVWVGPDGVRNLTREAFARL